MNFKKKKHAGDKCMEALTNDDGDDDDDIGYGKQFIMSMTQLWKSDHNYQGRILTKGLLHASLTPLWGADSTLQKISVPLIY